MRFMRIFKRISSAEQYLKHVRFAHKLLGHSMEGFTVRLKMISSGTDKVGGTSVKQAPAIDWALCRRLIRCALRCGARSRAFQYSLASSLFSRVQDELLPLEWDWKPSGHSAVTFGKTSRGRPLVVVDFRSRKNARFGARVERVCVCQSQHPGGELLCPVHTFLSLRDATGSRRPSGRIFPGATYPTFTRGLRADLEAEAVPAAASFTSHGFRRGSAQEYYERGSSLSAILIAGGWRSSAYLTYLQKERLDADKLFEALSIAESDEATA